MHTFNRAGRTKTHRSESDHGPSVLLGGGEHVRYALRDAIEGDVLGLRAEHVRVGLDVVLVPLVPPGLLLRHRQSAMTLLVDGITGR